MNIVNTRSGAYQDDSDSDITIINPSLDHADHSYVPIITRLKQANHSSENRQTSHHPNLYSSAHEDRHQCLADGERTSDFIFVHHDPLKHARQLEDVLRSYILDLKQESNCQLDCDKQLVIRIMDLIREVYSHDPGKSKDLDKTIEEIGVLHDKRHIEQKEKIENLRMEVNRLTRMLFANNDEQTVQLDSSQLNSMFSMVPRDTSMEQETWTEIEDDAKKLHHLIESQREKINVLASLISPTAPTPPPAAVVVVQPAPNVAPPPKVVLTVKPVEAIAVENSKRTSNTPSITALLGKISIMSQSMSQGGMKTTTNPVTSDTTLINHSPGMSPSESFNSLALSTLTPTIVNEDEESDEPEPVIEEKKAIDDQAHKIIDIPLPPTVNKDDDVKPVPPPAPATIKKEDNIKPVPPPAPATVKKEDNVKPVPPPAPATVKKEDNIKPVPLPALIKKEDNVKPVPPPPVPSPIKKEDKIKPPSPPAPIANPAAEAKKCPVCHFQFPSTTDDLEMYDHIDRCLFPSTNNTPPKDYECPNCKQKFSGYSDKDYLQHLNDCYNRDF